MTASAGRPRRGHAAGEGAMSAAPKPRLRSPCCFVDNLPGEQPGDPRYAYPAAVDRGVLIVTYIIAQPCVDVLDRACIDECPVDCIYEGERMLYIHPDECVDCGACEPVCPVEAIYYEDDVPAQWKDYYKVNVDFFEELGSPGGASKTGKIGKDHPVVAALPPQETEH